MDELEARLKRLEEEVLELDLDEEIFEEHLRKAEMWQAMEQRAKDMLGD